MNINDSTQEKDTKNRTTWWCLTAPTSPRTEINIKIIPHAKIPPTIGKFVTKDAALPYTATLIKTNATICKNIALYKCLR